MTIKANCVRDNSSYKIVSVFVCDDRRRNQDRSGDNRTHRNKVNTLTIGDNATGRGKLILFFLLESFIYPND